LTLRVILNLIQNLIIKNQNCYNARIKKAIERKRTRINKTKIKNTLKSQTTYFIFRKDSFFMERKNPKSLRSGFVSGIQNRI
jgi:hypothetical protein